VALALTIKMLVSDPSLSCSYKDKIRRTPSNEWNRVLTIRVLDFYLHPRAVMIMILIRSFLGLFFIGCTVYDRTDVNECSSSTRVCPVGASCVNTFGSFYCVTGVVGDLRGCKLRLL